MRPLTWYRATARRLARKSLRLSLADVRLRSRALLRPARSGDCACKTLGLLLNTPPDYPAIAVVDAVPQASEAAAAAGDPSTASGADGGCVAELPI